MLAMTGFDAAREDNRITGIEPEHGWVAAPEDIVTGVLNEGFEERKRKTTTSRRDRHPARGLGRASRALASPRAERDPHHDEGGEG